MRLGRARLCVGAALWFVVSCSLLVDEPIQAVRCTELGQIGPPACDPGEICGAGRCQACVMDDACGDGVDNDCDGQIDEGCGQAGGGRSGEGDPVAGAAGDPAGGGEPG